MNRLKKAEWLKFINQDFPGDWYAWGDTRVCVEKAEGLWHVSISCPHRYPTWDEIYTAWYDLVPDAPEINGAIILPRKAEYVNIHKNCFHVYQLRDAEIPGAIML
jgi:hypothetical protein